MIMTRTLLAAAAILTTMSGVALADSIDHRQAAQNERIKAARKSGQLTHQEVMALRIQQSRIALIESRAKSDGVVTRREARVIDRAQDAAGRQIARESHDGQKAWFRKFF